MKLQATSLVETKKADRNGYGRELTATLNGAGGARTFYVSQAGKININYGKQFYYFTVKDDGNDLARLNDAFDYLGMCAY